MLWWSLSSCMNEDHSDDVELFSSFGQFHWYFGLRGPTCYCYRHQRTVDCPLRHLDVRYEGRFHQKIIGLTDCDGAWVTHLVANRLLSSCFHLNPPSDIVKVGNIVDCVRCGVSVMDRRRQVYWAGAATFQWWLGL